MKICPLKMLYHILSEGVPSRCAAVICCEEEVNPGKLRDISYVHVAFSDVGADGSGAFTRKDARKIAAFIDGLPEDLERLYICCQAGQSRSPAVGASILLYFGQDDIAPIWKKPKYQPNLHVFQVMCQEFGIDMKQKDLRLRQRTNQKAFSRAIKG